MGVIRRNKAIFNHFNLYSPWFSTGGYGEVDIFLRPRAVFQYRESNRKLKCEVLQLAEK